MVYIIKIVSLIAGNQSLYGNKIIGSAFTAESVILVGQLPFYWTNKERLLDKDFKRKRIIMSATYIGAFVVYKIVGKMISIKKAKPNLETSFLYTGNGVGMKIQF